MSSKSVLTLPLKKPMRAPVLNTNVVMSRSSMWASGR